MGKTAAEPLSELLIFDQFEEILTLDPTDQDGKADFFAQVGAVLRDRNRWAIFSLCEKTMSVLSTRICVPSLPASVTVFASTCSASEAAQQAIRQPAQR